MSSAENRESDKSIENHSSHSESEERKLDSDHKKESKEKSHHREHDRHKEDRERSSKHRSSHHKSSRDDRHRDHRHKESDRHRGRNHKDEEESRSSKTKRRHSSRERDSHRDRDKRHVKDRSRSGSSDRSGDRRSSHRKNRHGSRDRKSSSRRHDSRDKKSHHRDKDRQKHESSSSRRDDRKQDDRTKNTESSTKAVEASVLSTKPSVPNSSLLNPDGTPNAQEILKSIKIPDHLKFNQIEAQKYQMEQLRLKTEELTGIKVPTFYNTAAVNPLVYAEQQKKRKLLWSKAKDNGETTTSLIGKAIVEGQDEKTSEKFRKLMGLKSTTEQTSLDGAKNTTQMKQKFNSIAQAMDKEYEMARMTTHTHRGQGLGFATAGVFDPNQPRPT